LQIHDHVIFRNSLLTSCMLGYAMADPTETQVLEILRRMQSDIAEIKAEIRDTKGHLIGILTQLSTMQSDALRQERTVTTIEIKVDRIETRLEAVCRS
jgi:hypothetical protein